MKIIDKRERQNKKTNKQQQQQQQKQKSTSGQKLVRFSPTNIESFFNFKVEFRVSFINYLTRKKIIRVKGCCGVV